MNIIEPQHLTAEKGFHYENVKVPLELSSWLKAKNDDTELKVAAHL